MITDVDTGLVRISVLKVDDKFILQGFPFVLTMMYHCTSEGDYGAMCSCDREDGSKRFETFLPLKTMVLKVY